MEEYSLPEKSDVDTFIPSTVDRTEAVTYSSPSGSNRFLRKDKKRNNTVPIGAAERDTNNMLTARRFVRGIE